MYSGQNTFDQPLEIDCFIPKYKTSDNQRLKVGFPIRKSSGQSLLVAHRSLSQRATSFIASTRQGIHRKPLKRLISAMFMCGERLALNGQFTFPHLNIAPDII
jgi:hypothetical protein